MTTAWDAAPAPALASAAPSLSVRALATAALVAAAIGLLFPYVTLRLGFGPNVSLVSTLLGSLVFSAMRPQTREGSRFALHASQAAGVAAGQTAFMGVALLAFDLLRRRPGLGFELSPTPGLVFVWLAAAGTIGVLVALPLRSHYLDREKLSFAAGEAAAEAILVLERRGARPRMLGFAGALAASAALALSPLRGVSAMALGSGMLIGVRVALSLGLGALLARVGWPLLSSTRGDAVAGLMWPAAGLMLGGGLTLMLAQNTRARAESLLAALRSARPKRSHGLACAGVVAAVGVLCVVDRVTIGLPVWLTLASVGVSLPLLVVGTRVLGETNWAPVAVLAAAAQAALAPLAPGCAMAAMVGSTVAAAIPNGGQHMMQSLRAAAIVGARPRDTALAQLVGVVVGSAALSLTYPALVVRFGVHEGGLWSPLSVSWAGFVEVFSRGFGAFPPGVVVVALAAVAVGAVLAVVERRWTRWTPSPTALGMGLLMPASLVAALVAGSLLACLVRRTRARALEAQRVPVAAGLIAGEAVVAGAQAAWAVLG